MSFIFSFDINCQVGDANEFDEIVKDVCNDISSNNESNFYIKYVSSEIMYADGRAARAARANITIDVAAIDGDSGYQYRWILDFAIDIIIYAIKQRWNDRQKLNEVTKTKNEYAKRLDEAMAANERLMKELETEKVKSRRKTSVINSQFDDIESLKSYRDTWQAMYQKWREATGCDDPDKARAMIFACWTEGSQVTYKQQCLDLVEEKKKLEEELRHLKREADIATNTIHTLTEKVAEMSDQRDGLYISEEHMKACMDEFSSKSLAMWSMVEEIGELQQAFGKWMRLPYPADKIAEHDILEEMTHVYICWRMVARHFGWEADDFQKLIYKKYPKAYKDKEM